MTHIKNKADCCGCGSCGLSCPNSCITLLPDHEGFLYPVLKDGGCSDCGICKTACPMAKSFGPGQTPLAFAAWSPDAITRNESSSGGVFSALMRVVFDQEGVVFGAAFDADMKLLHQEAHDAFGGIRFRGSKYLQSEIGDSYRAAKYYLNQKRVVLFSGTPCQIAGLNAFLRRGYENLITCDVICHGVPSPKVFHAYKRVLEHRYGARAGSISFRRKDSGWKCYSVAVAFENGTEYVRKLTEDPFMIGFLRDIYLRPSCHSCKFSRIPRVADISLGDFWGVGDHHPDWDDDRGTSLVLAQTEKGINIFDACRHMLEVHAADLDIALKSNPSVVEPSPAGTDREAFFNDLSRLPMDVLIKKYMSHIPLRRRIARKFRSAFIRKNRRPAIPAG